MPYSILVVDDAPANVRLLTEILSEAGYKVRIAVSGEMAIESVRYYLPDLILLDIYLPGLNGFQVCDYFKAQESTKEIPIIFISAIGDTADKVQAFHIGGVDYVTKPFKSREVLARVQTHLKLRQMQKDLQRERDELKKIQQDLEQHRFDLQQKVETEIKKRQEQEQLLIQQSKMAVMGEMLSAITHQWRQPLNIIGIIAQDLIDAQEFGELSAAYLQKNVSDIMRQVFFMSQTIDDFRAFFKPAKTRQIFNVCDAVKEVIKLLSPQYRNHSITMNIECPSLKLFAEGFPNEFKQVLCNLLSNSHDAILQRRQQEAEQAGKTGNAPIAPTNGNVSISINENQQHLYINVKDNGCGIPPDVLSSLFQPYITSKGEHGTGIGLYMSKTIIENNMQGKLTAKNYENSAEFIIILPKRDAPPENDDDLSEDSI